VRATALGMRNLERIAKLLVPAAAAEEGETYDALEETYGRLVGQWATELGHVARIPGGQYKQEKVIGQTGPVFRPVEARRQREAVAFLNQKAFTTPTFLLDPTVLRRFEAQGSVDRIGAAQRRVLTTLLDNSRLQRMVEHEGIASAGGSRDVYPLGQMLTDLRRGIWAEAYRGGAADPYRRRLQRSYLELVAAKINPPATPTLPPGLPPQLQQLLATQNAQDARALLRGDLVELDRDLARAVGRVSDRTTRLHLQDARAQIDRILHPDGEGRRAN
jgi:hypothetical protein